MLTRQSFFRLGAGICLAALANLAQADTTPDPAKLQIQVLAGTCANCHAGNSKQSAVVPVIAGRPASVLKSKLLTFKRGEDAQATVMSRHAAGYTDDELAALADYFSRLGR